MIEIDLAKLPHDMKITTIEYALSISNNLIEALPYMRREGKDGRLSRLIMAAVENPKRARIYGAIINFVEEYERDNK